MSLRGKSYQCSVCGKEFSLKSSLKIHQLVHSKFNNAKECTVCSREFSLSSSLQTHMLIHVHKIPNSCTDSEEVSSEKGIFHKFMNVHDAIETCESFLGNKALSSDNVLKTQCERTFLVCSVCKKRFSHSQRAQLTEHIKLHDEEGIICSMTFSICTLCKCHFSSKKRFEEHLKTHDNKDKLEHPGIKKIIATDSESQNSRETSDYEFKLKCSICGKSFTYQKSFKKHMLTHSSECKIHKCSLCNQECQSLKVLEEHILIHKKSVNSRCRLCKKQFSSAELFQKHVDQDLYPCKLCKESFSSCTDVKTHLKSHSLNCYVCGKHYKKFNLLKQHVLSHTEEQECTICKKKYPNQLSLHRHNLSIHGANRHVQCDLCGKLYEKRYLKSHMLTHSGERPYKCDICESRFVQRIHLHTHMKIHTGERKYKCDTCGKAFALKNTLLIHQRTHTGEKPYACNPCSKMFTTLACLRQHQRTHMPNEKCQLCGKKFAQKHILHAHYKKHSQDELQTLNPELLEKISKVHLPRKHYPKIGFPNRYKCAVCGKGFNFKVNLQAHVLLHTGEKPFSCVDCGKKFRLKYSLKLHERIHSGERPYQCSICNKRFVQYAHAKTHLVLHTGEKPYSCPVCGKAFADKNNLSNHKKIHLKESAAKDIKCKDTKSMVATSLLTTSDQDFKCTYDVPFTSKRDLNAHQDSHSHGKLFHSEVDMKEGTVNESFDSNNFVMVTCEDEYCEPDENPSFVSADIGTSCYQPLRSHIIIKSNPDVDYPKGEIIVHEIEESFEEEGVCNITTNP